MFYNKKGKTVDCYLCYRGCKIADGRWGYCGVRQNIGGRLYAMSYGKAASYAVDPIEKKPFYHFWPGSTSFSIATVGCNFRCLHCQNSDISQAKPGTVPETDMPPETVVKLAKNYNCQGISYTYTEPTIFFEYAYDTGVLARKQGLYNSFVTNGYAQKESITKSKDFLDAARIDLKGDKEHYLKVCGGVILENVLRCIKDYFKTGMHIEIITLAIEKDNDNKDWVHAMADFLKKLSPDIPWHFTAFYPAYKMLDKPRTSIATLEKMHDWAVEGGMHYVYTGNIPGHRYENTYCPKCGALAIERRGFSVIKVNLAKGNRCRSCGEKIPIIGKIRV
jgi:pyruvate formate lyase activating enzyme